ncbi:precorrin-3B synthase [Methylobrevis sp. L22]|uniref:Precorrin-3B synthase n=2 Tax=Methylobrevis albus TaxID=2793297 RepID=A0A931HXY0_9HYPH|nr:precorrin-3B synthase [Methylobrevis albus]
MASGDGLIVRVRPHGGLLTQEQALALATLSATHGNGLIDISRRANLQLRGVGEATFPALLDALDGFGLLDPDAESEGIRNIIAPPLAGLDATAIIDGVGLVAALEAVLAGDDALRALPQKFGFLVDEGGALPLGDVAADIRLTGVMTGAGARVLVAVGGDAASAVPLGLVEAAAAAAVAGRLARGFLELGTAGGPRRMAGLVREVGAEPLIRLLRSHLLPQGEKGILAGAGDREPVLPAPKLMAGSADPAAETSDLTAGSVAQRAALGVHPAYVGIAAPFGRIAAADFAKLAALAPGGVRPTPWRGLILAGADAAALALAASLGLVTRQDDPRLGVDACPGAPDCNAGEAETRGAAATLAPLLRGETLHVSGCAKGCARSAPARYTLVGRAGAYDLIENGRADAAPTQRGLSLNDAAALIGAGAATGRPTP